jgi:ATP-dependent DNA helicase DinG
MKGRNNYLCLRRFKNFSRQPLFEFMEDAGLFEQITTWMRATTTGDRAELLDLPDAYQPWNQISSSSETCLGQKCPVGKDCFITVMKQISLS